MSFSTSFRSVNVLLLFTWESICVFSRSSFFFFANGKRKSYQRIKIPKRYTSEQLRSVKTILTIRTLLPMLMMVFTMPMMMFRTSGMSSMSFSGWSRSLRLCLLLSADRIQWNGILHRQCHFVDVVRWFRQMNDPFTRVRVTFNDGEIAILYSQRFLNQPFGTSTAMP